MIPVTAAILLDERGRVLLTQRPIEDSHAFKWEFPGGKMRDRESPEDSLQRELLEELGIEVEVREIFHVVNHRYPCRSILLLAYLCRWKGGDIHLREHHAYEWVDLARLMEVDMTEADRPVAQKLVRTFANRRESSQAESNHGEDTTGAR